MPYVFGSYPQEAISKLKDLTQKLFAWFALNKMKANLSKYHVLLGTTEAFKFETSGTVIRNSHSKKLLEEVLIAKEGLKNISTPSV